MARSRLAVLTALVGLAAASLVHALDAPLDGYRRAEGRGEVATVRGRVFEERRKPSAPDLPLTGTAVSVLPHSEAWLLRLEAIKRGSRDSIAAYREAATAVRRSRDGFERSVLEAGGGDLSQSVTVDGEGGFTFDGVPAGPWILFASRSTYVSRTPQLRAPPQGPGVIMRPPPPPSPFLQLDKLAGYHVVTYWVRTLTLSAGVPESVELTDRNIWFSGIIESRDPVRLPDVPYNPPR